MKLQYRTAGVNNLHDSVNGKGRYCGDALIDHQL